MQDDDGGMALVLDGLAQDPNRAELFDELCALAAIYGDHALSLAHRSNRVIDTVALLVAPVLELVICTPLASVQVDDNIQLALSIPLDYPTRSAPRIELKDQYIGSYSVDASLQAVVRAAYMLPSESDAQEVEANRGSQVQFLPGQSCLYDGIEYVREVCLEHVTTKRRADKVWHQKSSAPQPDSSKVPVPLQQEPPVEYPRCSLLVCPTITTAEPILDRKSVFIGHAARVTHIDEVRRPDHLIEV